MSNMGSNSIPARAATIIQIGATARNTAAKTNTSRNIAMDIARGTRRVGEADTAATNEFLHLVNQGRPPAALLLSAANSRAAERCSCGTCLGARWNSDSGSTTRADLR